MLLEEIVGTLLRLPEVQHSFTVSVGHVIGIADHLDRILAGANV